MTITGTEIASLVAAYRSARQQIDALPDAVEREVGLASLRIEAGETLKQIATTGGGLTEDDLSPLRAYVADLVGGERAEKAVAYIDGKLVEAAKGGLAVVTTAALTGAVSLGAGVSVAVAFLTGVLDAAGEALGGLLSWLPTIGGGVAFYAMRAAGEGFKVAGKAASGTAAWADNLGVESDRALSPARSVSQRLWAAAGGRVTPPAAFTSKARARAQLIVWGAFGVIALCAVYIAVTALG